MKRWFFFLILLAVLTAPPALILAAMEPAPLVRQQLVSSHAAATRTRAVVRKMRALSGDRGEDSLVLSEADLNSILATGLRPLKEVRGQASVSGNKVHIQLSADLSRLSGGKWLNLAVTVPRSDRGLQLGSVRLGPYELPPWIILPSLAYALDLALGDRLGHAALGLIDKVDIEEKKIVLGIGLDPDQRQVLAERARSAARSAAGLSQPEHIRAYVETIEVSVANGQLSGTGSLVPVLDHALGLASRRATQTKQADEVKAALFAIAIACGHPRFQEIVGSVAPSDAAVGTGCNKVTLLGRRDLAQHFVISAGLHAAADSGVAFAIGELKELLDSSAGGSGFSFDDLAADRAGVAFAQAMLDADQVRLARMLEQLSDELVIMPSIGHLPSGMSEREFSRQFSDMDSDAYKAMVDEIDRRISALPMYSGR